MPRALVPARASAPKCVPALLRHALQVERTERARNSEREREKERERVGGESARKTERRGGGRWNGGKTHN